jgi:hypothetical protein
MKPTVVKPLIFFLCSGCHGLADPAAPSLLIGTLLLALTAVPAYIYWFGLDGFQVAFFWRYFVPAAFLSP